MSVKELDYKVLDTKLKALIQACKSSGNFKKLAVVGFIVTNNIVNEIGIKLGMRSRHKQTQEKLFEYMYAINGVFETNLKITIFQNEIIDTTKEVELLFLRNRGKVPFEYIKKIFEVYYELRKFEVPNLHKGISGESLFENSGMNTLNYFSRRSKAKYNSTNKFKPIILHTITQKETQLQKKLSTKLDGESFERVLYLRNIKKNLENNGKNKIILSGLLKDSIIYERSQSKIIGYMILGAILLSVLFGTIILIEMFMLPVTTGPLNHLLLISFGVAVLFILLYRHYFRKR